MKWFIRIFGGLFLAYVAINVIGNMLVSRELQIVRAKRELVRSAAATVPPDRLRAAPRCPDSRTLSEMWGAPAFADLRVCADTSASVVIYHVPDSAAAAALAAGLRFTTAQLELASISYDPTNGITDSCGIHVVRRAVDPRQ